MAEETKTPAQKANEMLQNAMGLIAVETGMVTEFVNVPQVRFREANEEEQKQIAEAKKAREEAIAKKAKEEEA